MTDRPEGMKGMDPFETWRSIREVSVDAWSRVMTQAMNSEAYAQVSGAILDAYLSAPPPMRQAISTALSAALQQLNLPSRSDVLEISSQLASLDAKVSCLLETLAEPERRKEQRSRA
jgi:hypothetical protein